MRITFDSNILIYAADANGGERHDQSSQLISRAAQADCIFTVQSLAEFFHVSTRKGKIEAEVAAGFASRWASVFRVVGANVDTVFAAIDAVKEHKIGFFDAMLWATARQAGCQMLLSEDFQDGRELEAVLFINPFAQRNAPLLNAALSPARRHP